MGLVSISGGAGGGVSSDELSATKDMIVAGKTYVGADTDDEAGTGTLADHDAITDANSVVLNGSNYYVRIPRGAYRKNATSGYPEATGSLASLRSAIGYTDTSKVLSGTTIAGMNGTLTVSPATNFKAAQYANKTPQCTWARPAHGSMWSGIRILWRTDRYPENVNDGNVFYEGADVYGRKNIGTNGTIYFGAWSYLTTNYGRIYSARMTTSVNLSAASGRSVLTSSGTFTVPANVRHIKVFMIGGGAEGGHSDKTHGGGGGGGYPNTVGIDVSPGQQIGYAVGNGGSATVFGNYSASPGDNIQYYSYDGGNGGARATVEVTAAAVDQVTHITAEVAAVKPLKDRTASITLAAVAVVGAHHRGASVETQAEAMETMRVEAHSEANGTDKPTPAAVAAEKVADHKRGEAEEAVLASSLLAGVIRNGR